MDELQALRQEIDAVDKQMVELFRRRMDVTRRVGEYKAARGIPVLDQAREQNASVVVFPELSLTGASCGDLFRHLFGGGCVDVIQFPLLIEGIGRVRIRRAQQHHLLHRDQTAFII